jgi:hypothetical protein
MDMFYKRMLTSLKIHGMSQSTIKKLSGGNEKVHRIFHEPAGKNKYHLNYEENKEYE